MEQSLDVGFSVDQDHPRSERNFGMLWKAPKTLPKPTSSQPLPELNPLQVYTFNQSKSEPSHQPPNHIKTNPLSNHGSLRGSSEPIPPRPLLATDSSARERLDKRRRFMWKLISGTMVGRAVVLTTHSMEECEALCNRASPLEDEKPRQLLRRLAPGVC